MTKNATTFPAGNGKGYGGPANGPGKGEGWGGPAGGKRAQFGQGAEGRPAGIRNGEGKAARARAALEDAAPLAIETVIGIARNPEDPRALQAALAVLNRIGLHEKSGLEMTGAEGGAVITRIERVVIDPAGKPASE